MERDVVAPEKKIKILIPAASSGEFKFKKTGYPQSLNSDVWILAVKKSGKAAIHKFALRIYLCFTIVCFSTINKTATRFYLSRPCRFYEKGLKFPSNIINLSSADYPIGKVFNEYRK